MSDWFGSLAPAVETRLRDRLAAIPGCMPASMRTMTPSNPVNRHLLHVFVELAGWSPSLHPTAMMWRTTVRRSTDADMEDIVAAALAERITRQESRRAHGIRLGREHPFALGERGQAEVDHMEIDAGLAQLLRLTAEWSVRHVAAEVVDSAHSGRMEGLSEEVGDPGSAEGSIHGIRMHKTVHLAQDLLYDGAMLWIHRRVPASLAVAAVGRRLGEIVKVPEAIAGHLVTEVADDGDNATEFHVEPNIIRVGDCMHDGFAKGEKH